MEVLTLCSRRADYLRREKFWVVPGLGTDVNFLHAELSVSGLRIAGESGMRYIL